METQQRRLAKYLMAVGALDNMEEMRPSPETDEWRNKYEKMKSITLDYARWYAHSLKG